MVIEPERTQMERHNITLDYFVRRVLDDDIGVAVTVGIYDDPEDPTEVTFYCSYDDCDGDKVEARGTAEYYAVKKLFDLATSEYLGFMGDPPRRMAFMVP